jgi:hypothetical protein
MRVTTSGAEGDDEAVGFDFLLSALVALMMCLVQSVMYSTRTALIVDDAFRNKTVDCRSIGYFLSMCILKFRQR